MEEERGLQSALQKTLSKINGNYTRRVGAQDGGSNLRRCQAASCGRRASRYNFIILTQVPSLLVQLPLTSILSNISNLFRDLFVSDTGRERYQLSIIIQVQACLLIVDVKSTTHYDHGIVSNMICKPHAFEHIPTDCKCEQK